ncbi:hypothetical protein NUW58_g3045 [Xylaria curta]|uniref:Uncharacterized protein n=1 Tax=Xylaria curta TaxID=42375 RepID=A0ACC1PE41_9PEZI|nr:hypothetical protein NUW58_g3045 [Xylaria curta]
MSDQSDTASETSSTRSSLHEDPDDDVQNPQLVSRANAVRASAEGVGDHRSLQGGERDNTDRSENSSQKDLTQRGDVPVDAEDEPLPESQSSKAFTGRNAEGLTDLWNLLLPEAERASIPSQDGAPIALDVVVVHGFFGTEQSPWESPGAGSSEWLRKWWNRDCKVMSFAYDTLEFLSGIHTHRAIRRLAIKLLDDLKRARQESIQDRTILFVTHDLGGIIVKDALTVAALKPALHGEIFDFTRALVFYGCPHRSLDDSEMEDKLNRFLYRSRSSRRPSLHLPRYATRALARAVVDINQLYMDSKHVLRSYIFSISAEIDTGVDEVFDHYTSTMGVPFEVRFFHGGSGGDEIDIENRISQMGSLIKVNLGSIENERTLLSVAPPLVSLRSGPGPDHPFAWISDNNLYKSWYNQRKPQLLYLFGNTDTQSASEFVFYDLDRLHQESNGQAVVYFSFNRYDTRRNHIQDMFANIQVQMMGHFPTLAKSFTEQLKQQLHDRSMHYEDLFYWFEYYRQMGEVEGISCVLCNFDECEPASRELFLERLRNISQASDRPFRLLVTSHEPRALLSQLADWPALDLDNSAPSLNYISSAVSFESLSRVYSNVRGFRCEAEEELRAIAELESDVQSLIFQHVIQDDRWPFETSIRDTFGPLEAVTLESAIARILEKVHDKDLVLRALTFILYTVRTPTVWELASVIHLRDDEGSSNETPGAAMTSDVRRKLELWLAGIVTLSQTEVLISTRRIREALLAGLNSTSDLSHSLTPKVAHATIARTCLKYLSSTTVKAELERLHENFRYAGTHLAILCDRTSLLNYATQFWLHHFAVSSDSRVPSDGPAAELTSFCESGAVYPWFKAFWALSNPFTRSHQPAESLYPILAGAGLAAEAEGWCCGDRDMSAGLVQASFHGLVPAVRSLLPRLRYSVECLQETLVGAGAFGDEPAWLELITQIYDYYPDFPWTAQVTLVCRASLLGLEKVLTKLLDIGCPADEKDTAGVWNATPIRLAISTNRLNAVKVLLERGADPKQLVFDEGTLIHCASSAGNADTIELLVEHGVDLNATNNKWITAIYSACLWGNHEVVKVLASLGADPNIKATKDQNEPAWSPLTCAISEGHLDCVNALLNTDANLEILGEGGVPLRFAVNLGLFEVCRDLLDRGVDPNNHPRSPPMLVVAATSRKSNRRLAIIELLIEKGARVDDTGDSGQTALWETCWSKDPQMLDIVTILLEHGADVNFKSQDGVTPLHIAASQGNLELLKLLVKGVGVNVDVFDSNNNTPLSLACKSEDLVRVLLEAGANPNAEMRPGYPALPIAVSLGTEEVVRLLVQHGARIDPPDELRSDSRWEPLELAVCEGKANILRMLADGGGDVNRRFSEGTNLVWKASNTDALGALLEFRPKLDCQDDDGNGPLHAVTGTTPLENIKLLVRAGADINLGNKHNVTPLVKALRETNEAVADYLLSKNADIDVISSVSGGALHTACQLSLANIVKRLINLGADVNSVVPGYSGFLMSPLSYLFTTSDHINLEGRTETLDVLIEAGADVNVSCELSVGVSAAWGAAAEQISKLLSKGINFATQDIMGRWPLHLAAVRGDMDIFTAILDTCNKLDGKDRCGRGILSWAAQSGSIEIFEKALQLIGDEAIHEQDTAGWTPLCWAARGGGAGLKNTHHESERAIILLLLEKGAKKSAKSKIKGKEYTPEGIAIYHNRDEDIIKLLAPDNAPAAPLSDTDGTSNREKIDDIPSRGMRLSESRILCHFCLTRCRGFIYSCKICAYSYLCSKCHESKQYIHPVNHEFDAIGSEFKPSSEVAPSYYSPPTQSISEDSSDSSDSDTDGEGEGES